MVGKHVFVPFALAAVTGAPGLALAGVLALALGYPASAQDLPALESQVGLERIEDGESSVAVVFEGFVNGPDGAPAEGAVVVSSAGGRAVTDSSGSFRLEVRVPVEAESVQITAVGGAGTNLMASSQVALPASRSVRLGPLVLAQGGTCSLSWLPTFGSPGVTGGPNVGIFAMTVFDDGEGPALYAGGEFEAAGGVAVNNVAKWDGSTWTPLDSGAMGHVWALTAFDDGSGPALYAGGGFRTAGGSAVNYIAKWDGSSWSDLGGGVNSGVSDLAVFDDGGGPALYAGGGFTTAGGIPANHIAKWDGSNWTPLGGGIGVNKGVSVLTVFDDGSGSALYAGGPFTIASGITAKHIARWDGSNWSAVGNGMNDTVLALTVFDDGSGPALYAGGDFTKAEGITVNLVAKWDGSGWVPLGSGVFGSEVGALTVFDDGNGPALYAGGRFSSAGGVEADNLAKWDGSSWSAIGSGVEGFRVHDLTIFDDGGGAKLFAGGSFQSAGGVTVNNLARWNGSSWAPITNGVNTAVDALTVFDDGGGLALYAAGYFTTAGALPANRIARWSGSSWEALGSGLDDDTLDLAVFDDGGGPALYAAGYFTTAGGLAANYIAKWDGSSWESLGSGLNGAAEALAVFDDGGGPELYAGGWFWQAGGVVANRIAKWDGSSWAPLGNGVAGLVVNALQVFDDGSRPALYVGGLFETVGGVEMEGIAKWDGSSWTPLGSGVNGIVVSLEVFDEGGGPALYAGGAFMSAGGVEADNIAKWDGTSWASLGSGLSGTVEALAVFDDGAGSALYAGGSFTSAGGMPANRIAKWDGSSWTPLGSGIGGMNSSVYDLEVFDDGVGPALYTGGNFQTSPAGDYYLAKWGCAAPSPTVYCTAGTSASGCQALLSATGTASATAPSGFTLSAATVEGQKDGLFFFGTNGQQGNPWGNGTSYQCVVPPVVRTPTTSGIGTIGLCDGSFSLDLNALWCPSCPKPAKNPGAAAVVQAQLWYRDPASTSNQTTSLSDAIEFGVGP